MSQIFLDIETVPCDDPAIIAEIASTITPPGNYKKAETIAAWEQHEKPRIVEEVVSRTSFDGGYGRIICVGFAVNDNSAGVLTLGDEKQLITSFFIHVEAMHQESPITAIVGHNIAWDLRMLFQRAVVHSIAPPPVLLKAMHGKPWELADTMLLWDPSREKKISLEKLCKILGVPTSKGEMNGSMVAQYYKEGRLDEISSYCKGDVIAVRECYRRLSFATV